MGKTKLIGKIFGMALVFALVGAMLGGLPVFVREAKASPATIYVPDNYPTIQAAVDAASPGDTIIVRDGTYTENVDVYKDHLTIQSENGAETTIVEAAKPHDSVFDITAAYVNLSGFTATGSTGVPDEERAGGILLVSGAEHCNISNNKASNNMGGIVLYYSKNNTLTNNIMSENTYNFGIDGEELSHFTQDIDTSNLVDGKPIYYWVNQQDKQIPNDAGFVCLVNCTNIEVRDLTLMHNCAGVGLFFSTNSRIENVTASNNYAGIGLFVSSDNTISDNTCNDNWVGIYLQDSDSNSISGNTCNDNDGVGIYREDYLEESSNNTVYLNNFIDNEENAYSIDSSNTWNSPEEMNYIYDSNTYTSYLGNYWSDYTGVDADGDGIGDTPYRVDSEADNYPLIESFENYGLEESPGCFIATAAYGTPMAEEIEILREFRNEYLLTNRMGQALVDLYYRVSPPIAEFIAEHPSLKPIVRAGLLPAVVMSAVAINTTPAEKTAIVGLLVLVLVALAVWAMRRRRRGPEYT